MSKIFCIVGPTASGKTDVSLELAQKLEAEIICVDSLLVYKEFNIGTAKPTFEQRQLVPHHVIDLVEPDENFTAFNFCTAANSAIFKIQEKKKRVMLVGGSGLYLKALTRGMFKAPPSDPEIKKQLEEEMKNKGADVLYEELKKSDPECAATIHPHDHYRIIRALEVFRLTGEKFSSYRQKHDSDRHSKDNRIDCRSKESRHTFIKIGLKLESSTLRQRIEQRTRKMLETGLIDEVQELSKKYPLNCKPFKSVGYKETLLFLENRLTRNELESQINKETWALARRQMTWFRSDKEIQWGRFDSFEQFQKFC